MSKILVEPAQADDLDDIESLIKASPHAPWAEGMNLSGAENYWLLAKRDNQVLGGILVVFARPYGFVDFLCIDETVSDVDRGRIVSELIAVSSAMLAGAGATFVVGAIPHTLKSYRRVAKKRGYKTAASGALVYKRVA